ncbi:hypothetical protein AB0L35_06115 [Streptomyces sp. NPDC052309]|uniref:hypothetical protein n=1 Tax=Streptomyces sp. NPDC052309 TaxID=3155421 RepID=UPI00343201CF
MNDNRAALTAAVAGGYFLGRRRKAGLAIVVGAWLAGRRLGLSPGDMLSQGLGRLRTPQFQDLTDQVRGELLTAGREAFAAAANRRLTGFADALRDRTDALKGTSRRDGEEEYEGYEDDENGREYADDRDREYAEYDDTGYDDRYYDDDSDGYRYEDEEGYPEDEAGADEEEDAGPAPEPPRNPPARKAAPGPPAKKTAAKRAAAKKVPAKKAAAKKAAPAKRTTGRPDSGGRG